MTEKIHISLTPLQANAVQVALDTYIEMQSEDPDPDFSRLLVTANEALESVSRAFKIQEHDPIKNFKSGDIMKNGSPKDRGSADRYYGRQFEPHYYPSGTGKGIRIEEDMMTEEQIADYVDGWENEEDRKDWG